MPVESAVCPPDARGATAVVGSLAAHRELPPLLPMLLLLLLLALALLTIEPALAQVNSVATGDSVWSAVRSFFYGKWALVIGCLVLVGCVFAFFSKGAMFASVGVAAVVVIYLLPAIAQGLQSLAQGMVGN